MKSELIMKKITCLSFRQVIYIIAGLSLLVAGIINKDWTLGVISILFLYQGIFNTCLFGSCSISKR